MKRQYLKNSVLIFDGISTESDRMTFVRASLLQYTDRWLNGQHPTGLENLYAVESYGKKSLEVMRSSALDRLA